MLKKELEELLKAAVKELKEVHQAVRQLQDASTAGDIALGLTQLFVRKEPISRLLAVIMEKQIDWKKLDWKKRLKKLGLKGVK